MINAVELRALSSDLSLSCISTAEGVRTHLQSRTEIANLRNALQSGAATFAEVRQFVLELLKDFAPGATTHVDRVIAAVVVALENVPTTDVDAFLENLGNVRVVEMPIAPRVARIVKGERRNRISRSTVREVVIDVLPPAIVMGPRNEHPRPMLAASNFRLINIDPAPRLMVA